MLIVVVGIVAVVVIYFALITINLPQTMPDVHPLYMFSKAFQPTNPVHALNSFLFSKKLHQLHILKKIENVCMEWAGRGLPIHGQSFCSLTCAWSALSVVLTISMTCFSGVS